MRFLGVSGEKTLGECKKGGFITKFLPATFFDWTINLLRKTERWVLFSLFAERAWRKKLILCFVFFYFLLDYNPTNFFFVFHPFHLLSEA